MAEAAGERGLKVLNKRFRLYCHVGVVWVLVSTTLWDHVNATICTMMSPFLNQYLSLLLYLNRHRKSSLQHLLAEVGYWGSGCSTAACLKCE